MTWQLQVGGGITCFAANASGLPRIIIASELHKIDNEKYLAGFGGARFAGNYKSIEEENLDLEELDIETMSINGLSTFELNGIQNIYNKIQSYLEAEAKNGKNNSGSSA